MARRQVQSRDELEGLLAEGFREHGVSGRAYSRADVLDTYEFGCSTDVELFDFDVTVLGDDACLATYRSRGADGGWAHRASVWVKGGDSWRMLFHQGTATTEGAG